MTHHTSSRQRFNQYKAEFHASEPQPPAAHGRPAPSKGRDRSALELIAGFAKLLRGHRVSVAFSLVTLTVATLLALVPPAATKFVVDNVLGGKPLPAAVPAWVRPAIMESLRFQGEV